MPRSASSLAAYPESAVAVALASRIRPSPSTSSIAVGEASTTSRKCSSALRCSVTSKSTPCSTAWAESWVDSRWPCASSQRRCCASRPTRNSTRKSPDLARRDLAAASRSHARSSPSMQRPTCVAWQSPPSGRPSICAPRCDSHTRPAATSQRQWPRPAARTAKSSSRWRLSRSDSTSCSLLANCAARSTSPMRSTLSTSAIPRKAGDSIVGSGMSSRIRETCQAIAARTKPIRPKATRSLRVRCAERGCRQSARVAATMKAMSSRLDNCASANQGLGVPTGPTIASPSQIGMLRSAVIWV